MFSLLAVAVAVGHTLTVQVAAVGLVTFFLLRVCI
jgi:hypothetical protein